MEDNRNRGEEASWRLVAQLRRRTGREHKTIRCSGGGCSGLCVLSQRASWATPFVHQPGNAGNDDLVAYT